MRIEDMYALWGRGIVEAYDAAWNAVEAAEKLRGIMVCGMGGSGAAGDYLSALAPGRVITVKSFRPPAAEGYGVVAVSYSGNTWETLRCLTTAISEYNMPVVAAVSSGGRLREAAERLGVPHVALPEGLLPRAAFGHLLGALLGVAARLGLFEVSRESLVRIAERGADVVDAEGWAETWAPRFSHAEALAFIGCESTVPLAVRAKNEFAENAKLPGRLEVYPESAHNDIEAWGGPLSHYIAFKPLSSPCREIVEAVLEVYGEQGACGAEVLIDDGSPESLLEDMLRVTLRVGLTSVKTGRLRGVNPEETPMIARYKERVKGGFGSR